MIQVWRTLRRPYADHAFNGEGARLAGGRFNPRGTPLVYTSQHLSLSVLEILTQLVGYEDLAAYMTIPARFEVSVVRNLSLSDLPADWRGLPAPESTRTLGAAWVESQETLVLRVPSVVLPTEFNYLINPAHPDAGTIEIGTPRPLEIDPRLLTG